MLGMISKSLFSIQINWLLIAINKSIEDTIS